MPLIARSGPGDGPVTGMLVHDEGEPTGMIDLWLSRGHLSSVEYSWFTDEAPARWPSADQLRDH